MTFHEILKREKSTHPKYVLHTKCTVLDNFKFAKNGLKLFAKINNLIPHCLETKIFESQKKLVDSPNVADPYDFVPDLD